MKLRALFLLALLSMLFFHEMDATDRMKLKDILRNTSRSNNNKTMESGRNEEDEDKDDPFRSEINKVLNQCSDNSEENEDEDYGRNGNKNQRKHNRNLQKNNRYSRKNQDYYKSSEEDSESYGNNNRRNNNNNKNNKSNSYKNFGSNNNEGDDSDENNSNNNNNNKKDFRNNNSNNRKNQNRNDNNYYTRFDSRKQDNMDNSEPCTTSTGSDRYYGTGEYGANREYTDRGNNNNERNQGYNGYYNTGYTRGMGYYRQRIKRSESKRDKENQCTSQCVFGYMEMLDDDQIPSETLFVKWAQDHIKNDDLKRIQTLREIRKCFARLSTSDIEDGCEFSKELSNCLNLELD